MKSENEAIIGVQAEGLVSIFWPRGVQEMGHKVGVEIVPSEFSDLWVCRLVRHGRHSGMQRVTREVKV